MVEYRWRRLSFAFLRTVEFFDLKKVFFAFLYALFGFVLYFLFSGKKELRDEFHIFIYFVLGPGIILTVLVFSWNYLVAPLRMERQKYDKYVKLIKTFSPNVLEVFLDLTDNRSLKTFWNPLGNRTEILDDINEWGWVGLHNYNSYQLKQREALGLLLKEGFISSIIDSSTGETTFISSEEADGARRTYNRSLTIETEDN